MTISKRKAMQMIKKGEAKIVGTVSPEGEYGNQYAVVNNYTDQRTDHFVIGPRG